MTGSGGHQLLAPEELEQQQQHRHGRAWVLLVVSVAMLAVGIVLPQGLILAAGLVTAAAAGHLFSPPRHHDGHHRRSFRHI